MSAVCSAFSLDFTGNVGATLNPRIIEINVPIYVNVRFEAVTGSPTVVNTFDSGSTTALSREDKRHSRLQP